METAAKAGESDKTLLGQYPDIRAHYLELAGKLLPGKTGLTLVGKTRISQFGYNLDGSYHYGAQDYGLYNNEKRLIISGSLSGMWGCCGMCVVHDVAFFTDDIVRGTAIPLQRWMFELREALARKHGWGLIAHTDIPERHAEIVPLLKDLGYHSGFRFRNPRSHNIVEVFAKEL